MFGDIGRKGDDAMIVGVIIGLALVLFGVVGFLTKKEGNRVTNIIIGILIIALGLWIVLQNIF
jgi:threonine/homoserine/homoserine lactone efflux protein